MVLCHIVAHCSLWPMIINIENIAGNENTIAVKENSKVPYTQN